MVQFSEKRLYFNIYGVSPCELCKGFLTRESSQDRRLYTFCLLDNMTSSFFCFTNTDRQKKREAGEGTTVYSC